MIKDVIRISKELLYDKPFYGSVLLSLHKEVSLKAPTAMVGLQGIMFKLTVNPEFWATLSDKHKEGLLLHELGHIIYFHLTEYDHLKDKQIANIAMDLFINQTIDADLLPDGGCTLDKFDNMEKGKTTNWYYEKLMENKKGGKDKTLNNILSAGGGKGEGSPKDKDGNAPVGGQQVKDKNGKPVTVPDHSWEDVKNASDPIKKMVGKNTENMLRTIIKQVGTQHGSLPAGLEDMLKKMDIIEPPKFNWRAFMKRFVGTSTKTHIAKTRRKKSSRFPSMQGSREKYFSNILIGIDTSGSVSMEELEEFQNELHHMHKTGHTIEIILCDTIIQDQFIYNPKKPLSVKGRGGTNFAPVVDYYQKNLKKYSCLIYLTDGESWDVKEARGQILWCHSSACNSINESLPGKKIKLN